MYEQITFFLYIMYDKQTSELRNYIQIKTINKACYKLKVKKLTNIY